MSFLSRILFRCSTQLARAVVIVGLAAVATYLTHHSIEAHANTNEQCMYRTVEGMFTMVIGRENVPARYRGAAECRTPSAGTTLVSPDQVTLDGNVRREVITTGLGSVELRWPRSVEGIFGRTPMRATVDAANTVTRVIRSASFSTEMQKVNLPWKIVFMDENLSKAEIPTHLISNCHPGWMTPPANVYIVAQRVAAGCGGERSVTTSVADSQLAEVLVHEMAHALEFHMLSKNYRFDRMRAEGFATWFEQHAAQYSSFLNQRELRRRNAQAADFAIQQSPQYFAFSGSHFDYARAAMYFSAVEDRIGLSGISRLYDRMVKDGLDLYGGIEREFSWNRERLESEVRKVVEKHK